MNGQRRLRPARPAVAGRSAFTLVELLAVVSIIALLVGILIPSLQSARNSAKNGKTRALLKSITTGLDLFKGENEAQFRQSGGYPSSHKAEDPALPGQQNIFGAHWLVRGLLGLDLQGYIPRSYVPPDRIDNDPPEEDQVDWYDPTLPLIQRANYFPLDSMSLIRMGELHGTRPGTALLPPLNFGNAELIDTIDDLSVFIDTFGTPILYYAANPYGKVIATVTTEPDTAGRKGIYVQEDNSPLTGLGNNAGWRFNPRIGGHNLQAFGQVTGEQIDEDSATFAAYIHDHRVHDQTSGNVVKPVNPDTFLLITAGKDGIYGTPDDVNNFER